MLNPESITVLDPACGSGHILVVAYDVLKAMYLERGYRPRDIPRLILEKNLYGLDIDDRAVQLAGFALLMKARADDRRLLDDPPRLNVLALQESRGLDADGLVRDLGDRGKGIGDRAAGFAEDDLFPGTLPQMSLSEAARTDTSGYAALTRPTIRALIDTFAEAKTFGSLIQIPPVLAKALPELEVFLLHALDSGDVFARAAAEGLLLLVRQARVLVMQFDAVVANPPYMGSKYYDGLLKRLVERHYKVAKGDLYTCFIIRNTAATKKGGAVGMITIPNWMFISTFEVLRGWLFENAAIETFSHNGRGVFGSDFGSCAFTFRHYDLPNYTGSYKKLFEKQGGVSSNEELQERFASSKCFEASVADFKEIPGGQFAYWLGRQAIGVFKKFPPLGALVDARVGLMTSDNDRFLRLWWEVSISEVMLQAKCDEDAQKSGKRWFPHNKGGGAMRWYGNHDYLVDWQDSGRRIKELVVEKYPYLKGNPNFVVHDDGYYFRPCVSWSEITISYSTFRYFPDGFTFNVKGMSAFPRSCTIEQLLSFCNSKVFGFLAKAINPTVSFGVGDFNSMPGGVLPNEKIDELIKELISLSKYDWDGFEVSWNFSSLEQMRLSANSLSDSFDFLRSSRKERYIRLRDLEEENNRQIIIYCGLQDQLSPDVPEDQITLARADREKDCQRLISYAIGCMMGRYRLDRPGLIYAHSGNLSFAEIYNAANYTAGRQGDGDDPLSPIPFPLSPISFPPDADGIVPITEANWFEDDAANRVREFLLAVWGAETLSENLAWLAESLGLKSGETPDETIRRYLSASFFKDHLQTYKRRPIYWCFSSGKQKAFEALVYLHRYHEGTLARMRMEYLVPLQGKMAARLDRLGDDIASASTSAQAKRLQKDRDKLTRQLDELRRYDEQLRHYADQRIALDLDDGVKVNYAKFGNLLAEVKTVTGTNPD